MKNNPFFEGDAQKDHRELRHDPLLSLKLEIALLANPLDRQLAILRFISERTNSSGTALLLANPLGLCTGALVWPPGDVQSHINKHGPDYHVLGCCDESWEVTCMEKIRTAFRIPSDVWQKAPAYKLIYEEFGLDYVMAYCLAERSDGSRLFVCAARARKPDPHDPISPEFKRFVIYPKADTNNDFTDAELGEFGKICAAFNGELSVAKPDGINAPPAHKGPLESLSLDPSLKAASVSPYIKTLITRFYGPLSAQKTGCTGIPLQMKQDILRLFSEARSDDPSFTDETRVSFYKNYRGRVLTGAMQRFRDGKINLTLFEDTTRHGELKRMVKECRKKAVSFGQKVFKACLHMAEGVFDDDMLKTRLGLRKADKAFRKVYAAAIKIVTKQPDGRPPASQIEKAA